MSSDFVDEAVKTGTQGYVFKKNAAAERMLAIGGGQGKDLFSKAD